MTAEPTEPTAPGEPGEPGEPGNTAEQDRLSLEKKRERFVWYYLAYFLIGIHVVAFVMIYAVRHAK